MKGARAVIPMSRACQPYKERPYYFFFFFFLFLVGCKKNIMGKGKQTPLMCQKFLDQEDYINREIYISNKGLTNYSI